MNPVIDFNGESRDLSNEKQAHENENPGALAGATGVKIQSWWAFFESNLNRQAKASKVAEAVLDCDPEDRALFLETILDQIRPGWPKSYNIDLMHEATEWARCSTRRECKAYLWACWQNLPAADQAAFLGHVQGREAA